MKGNDAGSGVDEEGVFLLRAGPPDKISNGYQKKNEKKKKVYSKRTLVGRWAVTTLGVLSSKSINGMREESVGEGESGGEGSGEGGGGGEA